MAQWIITILILLLALGYALKKLIGIIKPPQKKPSDPCSGCSSDCSTCQLISKDFLPDKKK